MTSQHVLRPYPKVILYTCLAILGLFFVIFVVRVVVFAVVWITMGRHFWQGLPDSAHHIINAHMHCLVTNTTSYHMISSISAMSLPLPTTSLTSILKLRFLTRRALSYDAASNHVASYDVAVHVCVALTSGCCPTSPAMRSRSTRCSPPCGPSTISTPTESRSEVRTSAAINEPLCCYLFKSVSCSKRSHLTWGV